MTLTNRNLGRARLRKTSRPRGFCDDWLVNYNWLYLENGKMKCHPCVNTRQNNPFSAGSGCTNFRNSTLARHQKTSAHTDALKGLKLQSDMKKSMKSKRSVCDPLKLKMTPKVNYLGVSMTPENFFEGKTLLSLRSLRMKFKFNWANCLWENYALIYWWDSIMSDLAERSTLTFWNLFLAIVSLG